MVQGQRQSESASDDKPEAANVDNESIGSVALVVIICNNLPSLLHLNRCIVS